MCIAAIAKDRDRNSFVDLFDHFAPRLKSFFLRLGVDKGMAEDLAQEALLCVWRKARYFDPSRASASTWIFTIARNLRVDLARRARDPGRLLHVLEPIAEPIPDDQAIAAEREIRIRAAIDTLPPIQADVIRLYFFEDRPQNEIAQALAIPLGTVKSRVRLAMTRLRTLVEDLQ
jgi:RNA polymerase sigma-70 factor (ECF subfamily)